MRITDIVPWARREEIAPLGGRDEGLNPVLALQDEVNRAFENFWRRLDLAMPGYASTPFRVPGLAGFGFPVSGTLPRADVVETDEGVEVTVELPGLDEKDIELTLADDMLTVRGEKKAEHEQKAAGYYLAERSWGVVQRSIPLPRGLDTDGAEAVFRNGVLTVRIPYSAGEGRRSRRIEVKAA